MYLISAYFDEHTNKRINHYINRIAEKTGNTYMTDNHVPPHMTISSVEARDGCLLLPYVEKLQDRLKQGSLQFVSVGMFFPYVMYITPVLNTYLQELSKTVYEAVCGIDGVHVSRLYQPMQWLPHITIGKKLSKEEMRLAFQIMQDCFAPFDGEVISLGLAKTNPHEDIWKMQIAEGNI